jgi:hypothetical protein
MQADICWQGLRNKYPNICLCMPFWYNCTQDCSRQPPYIHVNVSAPYGRQLPHSHAAPCALQSGRSQGIGVQAPVKARALPVILLCVTQSPMGLLESPPQMCGSIQAWVCSKDKKRCLANKNQIWSFYFLISCYLDLGRSRKIISLCPRWRMACSQSYKNMLSDPWIIW